MQKFVWASRKIESFFNLDMILQAFEYEIAENKPGYLEEFFKSTEGCFKHPRILSWVTELYDQRKNYLASKSL